MSTPTREVHLVRRPHGEPVERDFAIVARALPDPGPGELIVRNIALSIDPGMRPRMNDVPSYSPPYELGRPLQGGAVGEVISSASASIPVGTPVFHTAGWREHSLVSADQVTPIPDSPFPLSYRLGILGMPGFTAYVGLFHIAKFRSNDVVYVSGAAGAVGGLVGQFARLAGVGAVVGSAGSDEKVDYLRRDLGFDVAFNYRGAEPLLTQITCACPDGIDVYFDNVGGEHLAASLEAMRDHGRIALCGTVSSYNDMNSAVMPGNMFKVVAKRLMLTGFLTVDHEDLRAEFESTVTEWLAAGKLHYRETVTRGLDDMPGAFIGMLRGANTGKAIVALSD